MANDQLRPLVELGASLPFWCVNLCGGTKAWRMTSVVKFPVKFPVKSTGKSEIRLRFGHLGHPRIAAGRVPERPKFWRMVGRCWDSTEHQRIFAKILCAQCQDYFPGTNSCVSLFPQCFFGSKSKSKQKRTHL